MATTQVQRPWNTIHSVAGRPRQSGNGTPSSSSNVESTACKRKSRMWLTRTPAEGNQYPYVHSKADFDDLRSGTYTRDSGFYESNVTERTMPSSHDSTGYAIAISTSSLDMSEIEHDFEDSDTDSDSEVDSDSEGAQYITIPHQSPWWKPPASSGSSFDATLDDIAEDESSEDDLPSSHSLRDVLHEQQYLVAVFHDELKRTIPDDSSYVYDDEWLTAVDAKLLLAPVEVFQETCMDSMATSRPTSTDFQGKSVPDVPIDLEDDFCAGNDIDEWEWEQPLLISRASFVEPRIIVDPHFGVQKVH